MGLLPTHAQWGWAATGMLLALRLIQGLAMGGEIGGANVYLAEHAPVARRGAQTSVLQWMGGLGILASTLQIVLLQTWLSEADFKAWGWRIPFLLSALLLLASMKARLALHESPVFQQLRQDRKTAKTPLLDCLRDRQTLGRMALLFFCVSAGGGLLFFCSQVYASVFLKTVVKMDPVQVGWVTLGATFCLFPLTYACGALSDRLGRRPVVLAGLLLGAVAMLPVYAGLQHFARQPGLIFALLLLPRAGRGAGDRTADRPAVGAVPGAHPLHRRGPAAQPGRGLDRRTLALYGDADRRQVRQRRCSASATRPRCCSLALVVGYFFLPETRGADLNA